MIKVEGNSNLGRDETNSAIISTDQNEYQNFITQHRARVQANDRLNSLEQKVLEQDTKLDAILEILRNK